MNTGSCDFAVIGGDMRQVYAARMLKERGYRVCCALLCGDEGLPEQELCTCGSCPGAAVC